MNIVIFQMKEQQFDVNNYCKVMIIIQIKWLTKLQAGHIFDRLPRISRVAGLAGLAG